MTAHQSPEPTIAEIERNVVFMAYVVETYGERYAPILDAVIADLEAAKRRGNPSERARSILDQAQADGRWTRPRRPIQSSTKRRRP